MGSLSTLLTASSIMSTISQVDSSISVDHESPSTDLISITSTQLSSALTTPLVEAKQEVSSPILLPRSSTSILQSTNMSLSPTRTTTVRSEKRGYILLYSLFGLLAVIICVVTTTLSAGFIHSWRALRYSDDNDLNTILNHTNTDVTSSVDDRTNRLGNSSKASLSLPLIPFHKSNVVKMDFKKSFDDNTF